MLGASRWAPPFCYTESRTALGGRGGGRFYLPLLSTALYCSPNWSWHQTQSFDLMLSHRANIELTSQRAGLPWGKGAEDGFTIHSPCFSPNWSWHQTQSFDLMLSKQEHIELRWLGGKGRGFNTVYGLDLHFKQTQKAVLDPTLCQHTITESRTALLGTGFHTQLRLDTGHWTPLALGSNNVHICGS